MMKAKIINATSKVIELKEGNFEAYHVVKAINPAKDFVVNVDENATYREISLLSVGNEELVISSDDFVECKEIIVYETREGKTEWRGIPRQKRNNVGGPAKVAPSVRNCLLGWFNQQQPRANSQQPGAGLQDYAGFEALNKKALSRIEEIEECCGDLWKLEVKICPAQCENLVQTCSEGIKRMKEYYSAVSENNMWVIYYSQKLRQLVRSLDRLLSTLWSSRELLQACGSQWGRMGLVLCVPVEEKTLSKFEVLINELNWNLDTIHYALHLKKDMKFKWNEDMRRYVLERNNAPARILELAESETLVQQDRIHLFSHLGDGSLLIQRSSISQRIILDFSWMVVLMILSMILSKVIMILGHIVDSLCLRQYDPLSTKLKFAAILKERVQEISAGSNGSAASVTSNSFKINHLDLRRAKRGRKLSREGNTRLVYKDEWCGQEVAVGISEVVAEARIEREANLMLKAQHPNVVDFFGWAFAEDASGSEPSGQKNKRGVGYLVMEWMKEDLQSLIERCQRLRTEGPFPQVVAVDILLQIVAGMIHIHNRGIMHRDLKAANCLVSPRSSPKSNSEDLEFYTVKVIDFGESKMLKPAGVSSNIHTANTGTRRYMAPEVWSLVRDVPFANYTKAADVFSFGMTCYEVATGKVPFEELQYRPSEMRESLNRGDRPVIPLTSPAGLLLREIMSKCWDQNPHKRPDFEEIQKDLWTLKYKLETE